MGLNMTLLTRPTRREFLRTLTRALAATVLFVLALLTGPAEAETPESYRKPWSDPALTARLQRDTEQHRKGDAVIEVVDAVGKPVTNAALVIRQQTHAFLFGCNLFALGQLATPELNRKYERRSPSSSISPPCRSIGATWSRSRASRGSPRGRRRSGADRRRTSWWRGARRTASRPRATP